MQTKDAKIDRYSATPGVRIVQPKLAVGPANGVITLAAGDVYTVFDDQVDKFYLEYAHLQNIGTGTIKYCINGVATADNFHEILPGGLADYDGLGGSAEFNHFNLRKLTVISEAGSKMAMVVAYNTSRINRVD